MLLRRGLGRFADILYPPRCLACPEPTETPAGLCGACWREVHFLGKPVCDTCGQTVPSARGTEGLVRCEGCSADPPGWDRGRAAVAYEGVGRRIVLGLKHGDRLDAVPTLARWMTGAGAEIIASDMLAVPVPLHWRRRVARRYNQAAELARAVARRAGIDHEPGALRRVRATPPQKGLSRAERRANLREAIVADPVLGRAAAGRSVLLIDDVMTTGATLGAATEALRDAGATRVSVLVLARVAIPD